MNFTEALKFITATVIFAILIVASIQYLEYRLPFVNFHESDSIVRRMIPSLTTRNGTEPSRPIGVRRNFYDPRKDFNRRVDFSMSDTIIYSWPSRGGVIIFEGASIADFDFLGLDRFNPPEKRHDNEAQEDVFCRKLLLLGAKWWDSYDRYLFFLGIDEMSITELEEGGHPGSSPGERYWVCTAWPNSGEVVISEFNTTLWGHGRDDDDFVPDDVARLRLCVTMDEKAAMLKNRYQGKTFTNIAHYQGNGFLNSWDRKKTGEHGELKKTWPIDGK